MYIVPWLPLARAFLRNGHSYDLLNFRTRAREREREALKKRGDKEGERD